MTKKGLSVLLVEDSVDDAAIIKRALQSAFEGTAHITHCSDVDAAIANQQSDEFDVVLIDYQLGGKTGLDLLKSSAKALGTACHILLTGSADQKLADEALALGADDYLEKDLVTSPILHRVIRYGIERKKIIRSLETARNTAVTMRKIQKKETESCFEQLDQLLVSSKRSLSALEYTQDPEIAKLHATHARESLSIILELVRQVSRMPVSSHCIDEVAEG